MRRLLPSLVLFASLILTIAVYAPGLHGAFVFDDLINITSNFSVRSTAEVLDLQSFKVATLSGTAGIFGRPISMASFAIDAWRSGLDVYAFKITNLTIHLCTGLAVLAFSRLLLQAQRVRQANTVTQVQATWVSLALMSVWLVHPLNLTSVLYVVQRMTSLSALFSVLGLACYLYGRLRTCRASDTRGWLAIAASFCVFTPLAALCKENGALLPLFLLLTEVVFFRFKSATANAQRLLHGIYAVTVLLPGIALLVYTAISPDWIMKSYMMRTFTLNERLMSETRVLWMYMRLIVAPDISLMGLHHDDFQKSLSLLNPMSTLCHRWLGNNGGHCRTQLASTSHALLRDLVLSARACNGIDFPGA